MLYIGVHYCVCVCEREKERPAADVMAIPAGLSCSFIFLRTNCCWATAWGPSREQKQKEEKTWPV